MKSKVQLAIRQSYSRNHSSRTGIHDTAMKRRVHYAFIRFPPFENRKTEQSTIAGSGECIFREPAFLRLVTIWSFVMVLTATTLLSES